LNLLLSIIHGIVNHNFLPLRLSRRAVDTKDLGQQGTAIDIASGGNESRAARLVQRMNTTATPTTIDQRLFQQSRGLGIKTAVENRKFGKR